MISETMVVEALKQCYDPEIPVNVVDLGLIYSVQIEGRSVDIQMTLTAKGCPVSSYISEDAQSKVMAVEGVEQVRVNIVWEPRWSPDMITPDGRRKLGME